MAHVLDVRAISKATSASSTSRDVTSSCARMGQYKLMKVFNRIDVNNDGVLDHHEIMRAMKMLGIELTEDEVEAFIKKMDGDGNGTLDMNDFISFHDQVVQLRRAKTGKFKSVDAAQFEAKEVKSTFAWAMVWFVVYLTIGYSYGAIRQGWSCIDAIYFVIVTLSTVGFGDMCFAVGYPDKVFGGFYVFVGVAFISTAVGIILDYLLRFEEKSSQELKAKATAALGKGEAKKFHLTLELQKLRVGVAKNGFNVLVLACAGAWVIVMLESDQKWTFADGFYFSCVTMTTVGYGDITPKSQFGRLFTSLYILVALSVIARAISSLASFPFLARKLRHIDAILNQFGKTLEANALDELCECEEIGSLRTLSQKEHANRKPHVTRAEFVLWQLMKQSKVDFEADIAPCLAIFDNLDYDGSGSIDQNDIKEYQEAVFNIEPQAGHIDMPQVVVTLDSRPRPDRAPGPPVRVHADDVEALESLVGQLSNAFSLSRLNVPLLGSQG